MQLIVLASILLTAAASVAQESAAPGSRPSSCSSGSRQPAGAFEGAIFASAGDARDISAITGRGVPLARLAETLSEELKAFVTDRTG